MSVTATYDGKTLRGYVDGKLQGEIDVTLAPLPPGTTSVGTRLDRRHFFTGEVYSARFSPRVLLSADFLKVPGFANPSQKRRDGFVYVADSAPWLQDFLHELSVFPNGRHDDQADSMSQALDWFKNVHSRFQFPAAVRQETSKDSGPIRAGK
jgi:hypothetical protein